MFFRFVSNNSTRLAASVEVALDMAWICRFCGLLVCHFVLVYFVSLRFAPWFGTNLRCYEVGSSRHIGWNWKLLLGIAWICRFIFVLFVDFRFVSGFGVSLGYYEVGLAACHGQRWCAVRSCDLALRGNDFFFFRKWPRPASASHSSVQPSPTESKRPSGREPVRSQNPN
jgi:hypothetical protein